MKHITRQGLGVSDAEDGQSQALQEEVHALREQVDGLSSEVSARLTAYRALVDSPQLSRVFAYATSLKTGMSS